MCYIKICLTHLFHLSFDLSDVQIQMFVVMGSALKKSWERSKAFLLSAPAHQKKQVEL